MIRIAVMAVVVVDPPSLADAEEQIAIQISGDIDGLAIPEDLSMTDVVRDEPALAEEERQIDPY